MSTSFSPLSAIIASPDKKKYRSFRLPSLVLTKSGTLLCAFEARTAAGDLNEMDLCLTRSTDGGKTWSPFTVLASASEFHKKYNKDGENTLNNPVFIIGNDGAVHLIFSYNNGLSGLFHTVSLDDGESFDEPENILPQFDLPDSRVRISCGPSHGVCMKSGRLITPVWISQRDFRDYPVYTLYSDDNGKTWSLGERVSENFDETASALLSDGSLLLNSRQFSVPYNNARPMAKPKDEANARRRLSCSSTGIDKWSPTLAHPALIDPSCEGSMTYGTLPDGRHIVLFVGNNSKTDRTDLTVHASLDDGKNWQYALLINKKYGGYSDIAMSEDGSIWVIHENEPDEQFYYELELFSFSLKDILHQ